MTSNLFVDNLEDLVNLNLIEDLTTRKVVSIFLKSINDWPNKINDLNEFKNQIEKFIDGTSTEDKIKAKLLIIDFLNHSWEAESLHQLLEVFHYYKKDNSITEIIIDLKIKLTPNCPNCP